MRDFQLEGRNRHRRQNQDNQERRDDNVGDRSDEEPSQNSSHQGGIIPENHTDRGLGLILEDHIDTETIHTRGGCVDEVILIVRSRDDEDTACVHTDMLAKVRTPSRMKGLTMRSWMR